MPPSKRAKQESKESKVDQVKLLLQQASKTADQLKTLAAEVEFLTQTVTTKTARTKTTAWTCCDNFPTLPTIFNRLGRIWTIWENV